MNKSSHKIYNAILQNYEFFLYECLCSNHFVFHVILKRDWLDLNFQMINTSRQTLLEIQNCSVYKVGNNILSNRLSCLNKKLHLELLNLPFETYKIKCKNLFLLWTDLIVFCRLFYRFVLLSYVLSVIMLYMHWWRNNKSF